MNNQDESTGKTSWRRGGIVAATTAPVPETGPGPCMMICLIKNQQNRALCGHRCPYLETGMNGPPKPFPCADHRPLEFAGGLWSWGGQPDRSDTARSTAARAKDI